MFGRSRAPREQSRPGLACGLRRAASGANGWSKEVSMSTLSDRIEHARSTPWKAAPNWYVTNGQAVVGPVNTNLLLRGIAQGRVERECYVAQHSWSNWREQKYIREIRSLRRWQFTQKLKPEVEPIKQAMRAPRFDDTALEDTRGGDELLRKALAVAVQC